MFLLDEMHFIKIKGGEKIWSQKNWTELMVWLKFIVKK